MNNSSCKLNGVASQHLTFKIKDLRFGDRQRFPLRGENQVPEVTWICLLL
jgi:hypothetical protein